VENTIDTFPRRKVFNTLISSNITIITTGKDQTNCAVKRKRILKLNSFVTGRFPSIFQFSKSAR